MELFNFVCTDENEPSFIILDSMLALKQQLQYLKDQSKKCFGQQYKLQSKARKVNGELKNYESIVNDVRILNEQIYNTANLADCVSAKVRRLDLARSRVADSQQCIHDLIDLNLCSKGVVSAINHQDYEKAAGHISRFLSMDRNFLQRTSFDVQGLLLVQEAVKTLENAIEKVQFIINNLFTEAVIADDIAAVEKYFKIYPLIGNHKAGIENFSNFIRKKISERNINEMKAIESITKGEEKASGIFADSFTVLLENFARVIEVNYTIIESFYGNGYLLDMVSILQDECDLQTKNFIKEFDRIRNLSHTIQHIKECLRISDVGYGDIQNSANKFNPKDIDCLITEIAILNSRTELYFYFVRRKVLNDVEKMKVVEQQEQSRKLELILNESIMNRVAEDMLGNYLLLERYFMEESIVKAIKMECRDNKQSNSSMVDDVFFILDKSIHRSFINKSLNGLCAVINNATSCLSNMLFKAIEDPLSKGYPSGYIDLTQAYNVIQNSIHHAKLHTSDTERCRINFMIQLNNADMCINNIDTLTKSIESETKKTFITLSKVQKQILETCISNLLDIKIMFKKCIDSGLQQIRFNAIIPRMNSWMDQFQNFNFHLTEEQIVLYRAGETLAQNLIVQIDGFLNNFKNVFTMRNYDSLVEIMAMDITERLERVIRKNSFNRLGGIVLDQEIRAISLYLTNAASWSVRDKMARLNQISDILNLEMVSEIKEYWAIANTNDRWHLTENDVKTILTLRSDFRMDDIKRLQLQDCKTN